MQALIPAAGRGTRLGEHAEMQPKGLVEIAGRPLLAHIFETAVEAGADELIVVIGYEGAQIIDQFGDSFSGVPITYVHQREQLGLGHAVRQAEPYINGSMLLLNGDNVFTGSVSQAVTAADAEDVDGVLAVEDVSRAVAKTTGVLELDGDRVTDLVESFERGDYGAGIALQEVDDPQAFGIADVDESGNVTRLVEKPDDPPSTLVTTGCYVLPVNIFHACAVIRPSAEGEYQLSEAVGLLVQAGYNFEIVRLGERVNVNTLDDIERAGRLIS